MSQVLTQRHLLPTYARHDVSFVEGDGCWLTDSTGKRYLDLLAGIAVVGLGHRHPAPLQAAHDQLDKLWHTSNLFYTEPMQLLAGKLSERFGGADAFFCNSGAEAIEAALKWARKATGRSEFVALDGSFHGRTFGALSVTGQPAKRTAFEPMLPGAVFATPETLSDHVGPRTAAILLEPVQGEGGIHPLPAEVLAEARALADTHGAMLIFDEIQTGVGRCGAFFAWQRLDVKPDALTLAKGLANGLPIGALLVGHDAPTAFDPGDHGSTFGGNPVVSAAACAVVDTVNETLLAQVRATSETFMDALPNVRGLGLLLGIEVAGPAAPYVDAALEKGLIIGTAGPTTLRLAPPLTISPGETELAIALLNEVIAS